MLLHGDAQGDVRLKPRDVIFVPVIGPVAAVTGDVKSPAIYEMLGNESLGNLLRMAGGVTAFGYSERLQVERVQNHEKRVAPWTSILTSAPQVSLRLTTAIWSRFFPSCRSERNVVRVKGNVNQPGTYNGVRVCESLISSHRRRDPPTHTFFDYALLQRREGRNDRMTPVPLNLGEALSGPAGLPMI